MKVIISDYSRHPDFIVEARQSIMRGLSMDTEGPGKNPLPYGIYLYGYEEGESRPSALGELYFYTQKFNSFENSDYNKAVNLSQYGKMEDFSHFRSLYIVDSHKKGLLYYHITTGIGFTANLLGSKILTAGTLSSRRDNIEQFKKSALEPVGEYMVEGHLHTLFLGDTDKFLEKFMNENTMSILEYDEEFLKKVKQRREE